MSAPRTTFIVPSYLRPERLEGCLAALGRQTTPLDEVLVVLRPEDGGGRAVARAAGIRVVDVLEPGVLAAMTAGARAARGDLIGFADDDAEPFPDWHERALTHLSDPLVGGVGGRDLIEDHELLEPTQVAGVMSRWGRLTGDHHRVSGPARDVDVLKAATILFRREALALPVGMRGGGAQVHFEVVTCGWAARQGYRLRLDPALLIDHLPGDRFDKDTRRRTTDEAVADAAYNYVMAHAYSRPQARRRRTAYGLLLGDRGMPGIGRKLAAVARGEHDDRLRLGPSIRGQLRAEAALRRGVRLGVVSFGLPRSAGRETQPRHAEG